ncbi:MAG: polyprenyl synthetase family protein [Candidatus Acididesulfobacter diazotrophicus]|uniref:Polyprenyl synthetase family protein n=1 Tax=Candidatus Acididesulfobacter diazotrophicus TaxID=2597226 RepID=A0A519BPE5_9DELT|nr:MAG: polyprenyl synthetase family protein [Candidatus Acididesulfobacter diazotrophicus]
MSETPLINKVAKYVISSGGKRIRPSLVLLCAKLCGYTGEDHILLATVIEFIHTATLLHDDVVDSALLRRGQSSANIVFGSEASVLVGDYLFAKSFEILSKINNLKIISAYANATTLMAEGEVKELVKTADINTTEDEYLDIIIKKTAVLFACASQAGAIISGKDAELKYEQNLYDYGLNIGIAFQLMDDTLDYTSKNKEFGKFIGNDLKEGKITLPVIHTLERCTDLEKEDFKEIIFKKKITKNDLNNVLKLINKYNSIEYTIEKANQSIEKAKYNLRKFENSITKESLIELADYVVERKL